MELASAIITDPADAEWIDAAERDNLPAGVKVKILSEDPDTGRKDMYVYFEPGYLEPRHTHIGQHSDVLLEGRWIIEGIEVGPGGYIYGPPNVPHGPFECPDGCLVFASFVGNTRHEWPPTSQDESSARREERVIVDFNALPWEDGAELLSLPQGVQVKIYSQDEQTQRTDLVVRFPKGYVEPEHTHASSHSSVLVSGRWKVQGREMGPGSHIYGPANVPHGPVQALEDCIIYGSSYGSLKHQLRS